MTGAAGRHGQQSYLTAFVAAASFGEKGTGTTSTEAEVQPRDPKRTSRQKKRERAVEEVGVVVGGILEVKLLLRTKGVR